MCKRCASLVFNALLRVLGYCVVGVFLGTLIAISCFALDTPILGGGSTVPSNAATNFSYIGSNSFSWDATEANRRSVVPAAGTLKSLYIAHNTAPTAGRSFAYTIQKNGADTSLNCTISDTATTCNDTIDTVSFAAGDTLSIKSVPSGTPVAPATMQISAVFSTVGSDGIILSGTRGTNLSTTATQYGNLQGNGSPNATLNLRDAPVPVAGTFDRLYVELTGSPGVGTGYTFTVLKNGVATALVCSVTGTNTTCNDTVDTVSVVADDLLAMQLSIQSGTPTARIARWGIRWTPSTAGENIFLNNGGTSGNTAGADRWSPPGGGTQSWNSPEPPTHVIIPGSFTSQKWRIQLNTAPGGTATWTFRSRKNVANGNQSVVISGVATSGSDMVNSDSLVAGDLFNASSVSANTPASGVSKWGWVLLDPNASPTPTPTPTATPTITPTATPTATPTVPPNGGLSTLGIGS